LISVQLSCDPPGEALSPPRYAVTEKALRRWARERVRKETGADIGIVYTFAVSA
jgi:hypothetical protein